MTLIERLINALGEEHREVITGIITNTNQGDLLDDDRAIVWIIAKDDVTCLGYSNPDSATLEELAEECFPGDWSDIVTNQIELTDNFPQLTLEETEKRYELVDLRDGSVVSDDLSFDDVWELYEGNPLYLQVREME